MKPTFAVVLQLLASASALAQTPQPIAPTACLRKMALDLTDQGPSPEEVAALRSGQTTLGALADQYLASPAFAQVVFNWFRGVFPPTALVPMSADVDEPARIARSIVTADRDFRELVTGRYTVAADGSTTPLDASAAGVLTTQSYLTAYQGIENRNWAGRLLRGMSGVVLTPVSTVPPGTDASPDGLAANPNCSPCHTHPIYGVDHVAAFRHCYDSNGQPVAGCTIPPMQFLGQSGSTVADLGAILAGSVEWRAKMVQTFYVHLLGRAVGRNEIPEYRGSESTFVSSGYRVRALLKQIVTSMPYCVR